MPLVIGLMSGTSVDGVDAALVDIKNHKNKNLKITPVSFLLTPFPKKIKERIIRAASPGGGNTEEVCRLNFELGEIFAQSVKNLLHQARISPRRIYAIGSHGQTICHLGKKGTLQIAEPAIIAERTGITTVADYRPSDIAAGGLGAPFAPYFHALLFQHSKKNRAVHNIGGISNVTVLPHGTGFKGVFGFDTGPGNMLLDGAMAHFTKGKKSYDHGGAIAARGFVSLLLLKKLMSYPFISQKPPKTAGREEFGHHFFEKIFKQARRWGLRFEDVIATLTAFTAQSIGENYRRFVFQKCIPDEIIFGGGGNHNQTLMKMLKAELCGIQLSTFEDYGISSDAVEALCFAVLAYQTLHHQPTNIPNVTGARHPVVMGKVIWKGQNGRKEHL